MSLRGIAMGALRVKDVPWSAASFSFCPLLDHLRSVVPRADPAGFGLPLDRIERREDRSRHALPSLRCALKCGTEIRGYLLNRLDDMGHVPISFARCAGDLMATPNSQRSEKERHNNDYIDSIIRQDYRAQCARIRPCPTELPPTARPHSECCCGVVRPVVP